MSSKQPIFPDFDSDSYPQKVVSLRATSGDYAAETSFHQHHKCQLVMALSGFVKCKIADAIWVVPPNCAVWIPSQVPHCNKISSNAEVCMLFIDPDVDGMPDKSCTLSISPLVKELIIYLSGQEQCYLTDSSTAKLVEVLIDQLQVMPTEHFDFPTPAEPRLNAIALQLIATPADRRCVGEWARQHAMSERTLARLVKLETGLTFGRWRGQLHLVLALQKLTTGDSVQRIADELGYESVSAFITFFKKTLGRPPKQYMKLRD
ncbi:helix-turn-helix transcriptional regulator [Shewanella sp. D64]|uniref:AraC family transcriptional regulator n=1 Tax=unclassified Shewanella TaxID=196818 RepID=UPI0022BA5240|nr:MULTISPECIES: helix-turn-helix transcriptional regulator [unclassified Shewanella]MEC4727504.1 helix-turn-helix transcriptional regulator [Shewanella sp. D64]MEC4738087.1 helix-turn-helix transcriptional regulator [Shewanella sp. E94]WBJ96398.1 helix-turn-helix transcriptional regulator [Shewanella sp. MTB7]